MMGAKLISELFGGLVVAIEGGASPVVPLIQAHKLWGNVPIQIISSVKMNATNLIYARPSWTSDEKSRYVIESFRTSRGPYGGVEDKSSYSLSTSSNTNDKRKSIIIQNVKLFQFRDDVPFTLIFSLLPHKGGAEGRGAAD